MDGVEQIPRPRWRGRIHQVAFVVSIPAGLTLVGTAATGLARVAGGIYALSLTAMYGVSAAFHRLRWSPRARERMRALDHSTIFLLIAGTYTPFSLLALAPPWSTVVLAGVWAGAVSGILLRLIQRRLGVLQQTLYLVLGWVAVFFLPFESGRLSAAAIALLLAGGVFYTGGALIFRLRRPDPRPAIFGYHEVWHTAVTTASVCHYILVLLLVTRVSP